MNKIIKQGALAVALLAGAALVSGQALANSVHEHGHFGGTWNRIGPSHHHGYYAFRGYRGYYGPGPYAYYGPRYYDYGYGYYGRPGVGFSIGIY